MSSTLCGPSNPLSALEKHTSTDRSLQHERLYARQPPPQTGFRNLVASGSRDEEEFRTFAVDGSAPPGTSSLRLSHAASVPLDDWATDFQKLSVGPTQMVQSEVQYMSRHLSAPSIWKDEFVAHPNQHVFAPHGHPMTATASGLPGLGTHPLVFAGGEYERGTQATFPDDVALLDKGQDRAFEEAFQEAAREVDIQNSEPRNVLHSDLRQTTQLVVENTQQVHEEQGSLNGLAHDPDELSRTARKLLDSVQDDRSAKFKESRFLALMKRLRDGEVKVEGDQMVETATHAGRQLTQDVPSIAPADSR